VVAIIVGRIDIPLKKKDRPVGFDRVYDKLWYIPKSRVVRVCVPEAGIGTGGPDNYDTTVVDHALNHAFVDGEDFKLAQREVVIVT